MVTRAFRVVNGLLVNFVEAFILGSGWHVCNYNDFLKLATTFTVYRR